MAHKITVIVDIDGRSGGFSLEIGSDDAEALQELSELLEAMDPTETASALVDTVGEAVRKALNDDGDELPEIDERPTRKWGVS